MFYIKNHLYYIDFTFTYMFHTRWICQTLISGSESGLRIVPEAHDETETDGGA